MANQKLAKIDQKEYLIRKVRDVLIIYLAFVVAFNILLRAAKIFVTEAAVYHIMVYTSFFIVAVGGLIVSIKTQQGSNVFSGLGQAAASFVAHLKENRKAKKENGKLLDSEVKNKVLNSEMKKVRLEKKRLEKEAKLLEKEKKKILKQNSMFKKQTEELSKKAENTDSVDVTKKGVVRKTKKLKWLSKRYPRMPNKREKRVQLYKDIAKDIEAEKGVFTFSDIMETLVDHFSDAVNDDRKTFLKEIQESIKGSEDTPLVKKEKGVSLFTTIKYGGEK